MTYANSLLAPSIKFVDESTDNDLDSFNKRFRIVYYNDIEANDIEVRFIYPNFSQFTEFTCPSYTIANIAVFDSNNFVPIKRIYSFWHKARNVYSIYAEGFRLFAILLGLLKVFIVLIRPFLKISAASKKYYFWMIYTIWLLESNSMFGFLGTNFRGLLGLYLEA